MAVEELSRIDRSITIKASPERVWHALTNAAELSVWFQVTIEGGLAEGNEVWMTSVHEQHAGQRFAVRIVEMNAPVRLVWEWHPGEQDAGLDYSQEPRTTVTFTLEPSGDGTQLKVAETGFDQVALVRRAKVYRDNSQGWTEVLVWLQKHVEAAN